MKILFGLWHPAHVHTYRNVIKGLEQNGHSIKVVAREKDITTELLDLHNIEYEVTSKAKSNKIVNAINILVHLETSYKLLKIADEFEPDILISRGPIAMSHISKLYDVPLIGFMDSDIDSKLLKFLVQNMDVVFTPTNFKQRYRNKNHIKLPTLKELAYLHPNQFSPEKNSLRNFDIELDEKYSVVRFVNWEAWHDVEKKGFSLDQKIDLVKNLDNHSNVYISAEGDLPTELENYALNIPSDEIHNVLYHADLFIGDSQTMATEAAVLGVPAIRHNLFVGKNDMSNFIELEKEYGLLFNFKDPEEAAQKSLELIKRDNVKEEWHKKRDKLLNDKIDLSAFFIWFIENYPKSLDQLKKNRDIIWEVGQ